MAAFEQPLDEAGRGWLLRHARRVIAVRLGSTAELSISPPGSARRRAGAFVTLYGRGDLRGCIGTLDRDRPLDEVVADMAIAAGFHDPRFAPLDLNDLDDLTIEISVLSVSVEARPEDVVPGTHGVSIAAAGRRAVYLPKVALEAGWDRERLLEETCLKAGLAANAWRDPATWIGVFTAETFGDSLASG